MRILIKILRHLGKDPQGSFIFLPRSLRILEDLQGSLEDLQGSLRILKDLGKKMKDP